MNSEATIAYTSTEDPTNSVLTPAHQIDDYSKILDRCNINYAREGYHLKVGEITQVQGWILHLSIVRTQVAEVLEKIVPLLVGQNIPFKVVQDKETARNVLDGNLGNM